MGPTSPTSIIQTPESFGAVGNGSFDDTIAIGKFFDAINGKIGLLSGTYKVKSEISKSLSNCTILGNGIGGLVGSPGYSLMRLLDVSNVVFDGVSFVNTYANATDDLGTGVVYSYQNNIDRLTFRRCLFSAPKASTQGLAIYTRINGTDNGHTVNGLWIEDNSFVDVGRVACIVMNRGIMADQYAAAQRVYFNRNLGKNIGVTSSIGFMLSLDGFGSDFSCDGNSLVNCLFLGLENTCWSNGSFRGNKFSGFTSGRIWSPMSLSNPGWDGYLFGGGRPYMNGLSIRDNICLTPSNQRSNFIGVSNSEFSGNHFVTSGDYAFHERDATNNNHWGDRYVSDALFAALIGDASVTTRGNSWRQCTADNSACSTNTATLTFTGGSTMSNVFEGKITKGTGGTTNVELEGASANTIIAS